MVDVQQLPAILGGVFDNGTVPVKAVAIDWKSLNDDTNKVTFNTNLNKPTYVELDLGVGGTLVDRVHLVHPQDSVGVTSKTVLYVMNEQRLILLQSLLKAKYPTQIEDFTINNPEKPLSGESGTRLIRYIRIIRTAGGGGMLIMQSMDVYLGSHAHTYFSSMKRIIKYVGVTNDTVPPMA